MGETEVSATLVKTKPFCLVSHLTWKFSSFISIYPPPLPLSSRCFETHSCASDSRHYGW